MDTQQTEAEIKALLDQIGERYVHHIVSRGYDTIAYDIHIGFTPETLDWPYLLVDMIRDIDRTMFPALVRYSFQPYPVAAAGG